MYLITTATKRIAKLTKRIKAIQGGTSAGKTIGILQVLIDRCQRDQAGDVTSVVSETLPHLKIGAIRDFLSIMKTQNYYKDSRWNRSDFFYTFETGAILEFFSADQPIKVRGPRRKRLFINEANRLPLETFEQLEVRTSDEIFLDWNPTNSFWFYESILGKRDDVEHVVLTYKENEALSPKIIASIEQRKNRPGWWKVYGLGQLGEVEGKIYSNWALIDSIPHEARLVRYGVDFGYTNDPTAIIALYYYNGGYIVDELAYSTGLLNSQIADILLAQENKVLVIADSAEPKSIDEIRLRGVNITGVKKGKDSVRYNISIVQDQKISVTKRSVNVIHEYRNFLWETDKNGKVLNEPEHEFKHCFAPETLIHTTKGLKRIDELVGKEGFVYSREGRIEKFYDVKQTRINTEVLHIEFDDGNILTVTPDHLLLLPSGEWIQSQLLNSKDRIQSSNGKTDIQWKNILFIRWREIFCERRKKITSSGMDFFQRRNSKKLSCSPQGRQHTQQFDRQFRADKSSAAFKRTYDRREENATEKMGGQNKTACEQMAWVKTGDRVAQITWKEKLGRKKTYYEILWSLPLKIRNTYQSCKWKILLPKLRTKSTTKTITRITRGFCAVTYNLEVENTHCLMANGVIAHNSMDAIGYAMSTVVKPIQVQKQIPTQDVPLSRYEGTIEPRVVDDGRISRDRLAYL